MTEAPACYGTVSVSSHVKDRKPGYCLRRQRFDFDKRGFFGSDRRILHNRTWSDFPPETCWRTTSLAADYNSHVAAIRTQESISSSGPSLVFVAFLSYRLFTFPFPSICGFPSSALLSGLFILPQHSSFTFASCPFHFLFLFSVFIFFLLPLLFRSSFPICIFSFL